MYKVYYEIARMEDRYSGSQMYATIDKKGNEYVVSFTNKGVPKTTRKTFESIYEALDVFEKYVEAFVLGEWSYEHRKSWLE